MFGFAGALIPVAIGIAILRYRLYDIDRLISRSLAYAVITGVLVAVFAASILLVAGAHVLAAHPIAQGQSIAVAVSTVVVFALFRPVPAGGPAGRRPAVRSSPLRRVADRRRRSTAGCATTSTSSRSSAEILGVVGAAVPPRASRWLSGSGAPR